MAESEITRALDAMREAQTILRHTAIAKRDVIALREAQANVDAIDRALKEERQDLEQIAATKADAERKRRRAAQSMDGYE